MIQRINWKYAFGEILIVIIGITIAFSLNKCAENTRDQNRKKAYIKNLRNDIQTDTSMLITNLDSLNSYQKIASDISRIIRDSTIDNGAIIKKVFAISAFIEFTPQDVTYQTLINSGDLTIFDDIELKSAIQKHYSTDMQKVIKAYTRQEIINREYLGKYYIYNSDFDKIRQNEFPFDDIHLLKRIVQSLNGAYAIQIQASKKAIEQSEALLEILNNEL